jgi:hypothetical protein
MSSSPVALKQPALTLAGAPDELIGPGGWTRSKDRVIPARQIPR